jgi:hypothetical protein
VSSFGSLSQLNDAEAAPAAIGVILGFHIIELDKYKLSFSGHAARTGCSIGWICDEPEPSSGKNSSSTFGRPDNRKSMFQSLH